MLEKTPLPSLARQTPQRRGARAWLALAVLLAATVLLAAECFAPRPPPAVTGVSIVVEDRSEELIGTATAAVEYRIDIDDPAARVRVDHLTIIDAAGTEWSFSHGEVDDLWDSNDQRFEAGPLVSSTFSPDHVPLGTATIRLERSGFAPVEYPFPVYSEGNPAQVTGNMWSEASTMTPTIMLPPTNLGATRADNDIELSFQVDDPLAEEGFVWLFDGQSKFLGVIQLSAIEPLAVGTLTTTVDVTPVPTTQRVQIMIRLRTDLTAPNRIVYRAVSSRTTVLN